MKLMKKTLIASAVVTGMLSSGAFAATVNFPVTAPVQTYGKVIANETVRTTVSQVGPGTVLTMLAGENLSVDDSVTFTLSGGATWAAIVSASLTAAPNVGGATFALVSGGAGQNFATYRVGTASTDALAVLTLASGTATINGAAVADNGDIQNTVSMSGFVGGNAIPLFGSPLTSFSVNLTPMQTAAITPAGGIVDTWSVATGFTTLLGTGTASSAAATVTVTDGAGAVVGATTGGIPAAIPTPANTIIAINGPMAGLTSITTAANMTSATAVGGVPTGGTVANTFFIDVANDAAYAIATAATPVVAAMTFNFDGTAQPISAYTAGVTRTADGSYSATTVSTQAAVATFGRNGSAFTSNSVGPLNKITLTDRSGTIGAGGADGVVAITAFDAAGAAVTCTGLSVGPLANNGTVTIQGQDITDACSGAKRVEGVVNSAAILVTNVKKTADGATASPGLSAGGTVTGI